MVFPALFDFLYVGAWQRVLSLLARGEMRRSDVDVASVVVI